MMTAYSTTDQAIEAMKLGSFDYLIKPFDNDLLLDLIGKVQHNQAMNGESILASSAEDELDHAERFIGNSAAMLDIFKKIGKIAATDVPVLILGESGTGKELVARALYHHGNRAARRFMAVNCAAIPEQLLESELFGYEKGAFTGADVKRIGKVEQCRGGTLFLDEIGELPLSTQAKLLRVLQDGSFQSLGGAKTIRADFRLLAATNRSITTLIAEKKFREDLLYRINTVTISIPPLRERQEDIPLLADFFFKRYKIKLGKNIKGITDSAMEVLCDYWWPGNVRELENFIHQSMIMCNGPALSTECCIDLPSRKKNTPACLDNKTTIDLLVRTFFGARDTPRLHELTASIQTAMINHALQKTDNNQVRAARLLGISRNTLRKLSRS
jgi:two-component system nitrogen regulation response regulator GlnG